MNEQYSTIKTKTNTKLRFDQFQLDLKKKGISRDQNEVVNMMIDISIEHIKNNCKTIGDLQKLTKEVRQYGK